MVLKETKIKASDYKEEVLTVPVRFTYELTDERDFQDFRAKDSNYIIAGVITQKGKIISVFSNARKHRELRMAVEEDIGEIDDWMGVQLLGDGKRISSLVLRDDLGNNIRTTRKLLKSFFHAIDPKFLDENVVKISDAGGNQYLYLPSQKMLRIRSRSQGKM